MLFENFDIIDNIIERAISKIETVIPEFEKMSNSDDLIESCRMSIECLHFEKNSLVELNSDDSDRFNDQFKTYITSKTRTILESCESIINTPNDRWNSGHLADGIKRVIKLVGNKSIDSLFNQFRFGDSNYVLFGKNGAGKTTLLNELSKTMFTSNTLIMSATRNTNYSNSVFHNHSDINLRSALSTRDDNKTMFYLSQLISYQNNEQRENNPNERMTIKEELKEIFNSLGTDRTLFIKSNGDLELLGEEGCYSLSQASDGEKTALYFIMTVLLAPKNSFLFIDEPENHLNGSLMQKLFDCLERTRSDLKFVYSTHNINFIESRNNIEIIYLRKTTKKNEWAFQQFEDFKELPLDTILSVEGTNDDVIFCEGENDKSFDFRLYSLLFPTYQIIPSQGCDRVVLEVSTFNKHSTILRKKAYGIIDYDYLDEQRIKELNKKGVYVLKVNEIENAYSLPICLRKMIEMFCPETTESNIEAHIIDFISKKKKEIASDYATKLLRNIHKRNKLDDLSDISKSLERLCADNNRAFLLSFGAFCNRFDSAVGNNDYDELMRIVPGKFFINEISRILGFAGKEVYVKHLLRSISSDASFSSALRNEIVGFTK